MLLDTFDTAEAVFFYRENSVAKEMLHSEFEAILDGYVPLTEFANSEMLAAYVEIAWDYSVRAAVFFKVAFDREGWVDPQWNVPLRQLAESGEQGPDLGKGPIKLSCYSQSPISWQQKNLWDPDIAPDSPQMQSLIKTIQDNRLGILFKKNSAQGNQSSSDIPLLTDGSSSIASALLQEQLQTLGKQQKLELSLEKNRFQQESSELKRQYTERLQAIQDDKSGIQQALDRANEKIADLEEQLESQSSRMAGLREFFEEKLRNEKQVDQDQLDILKQNHLVELQLKVSEATYALEQDLKDVKEQLDYRDVELMYMNTQEEALNSEIDRLLAEKQKLFESSGDQLLGKMAEKGVSFVAFQPGAGHMTVPTNNIADYMSDPVAYAAHEIGISVTVYKAWKEHSKNPVCNAITASGEVCGKRIPRVERPIDFFPGESDRCAESLIRDPFEASQSELGH